jgi:hypothetical protein
LLSDGVCCIKGLLLLHRQRGLSRSGDADGSIGVILEINVSYEQNWRQTEVIKSGTHKDIFGFRGIKEEKYWGVLDNVHEQFIKAVAEIKCSLKT